MSFRNLKRLFWKLFLALSLCVCVHICVYLCMICWWSQWKSALEFHGNMFCSTRLLCKMLPLNALQNSNIVYCSNFFFSNFKVFMGVLIFVNKHRARLSRYYVLASLQVSVGKIFKHGLYFFMEIKKAQILFEYFKWTWQSKLPLV